MMTSIYSAGVAAGLCLLCTSIGADQSMVDLKTDRAANQLQATHTVEFKQLPAPVQATLAREGDRIGDIRRQAGNGSTVYEATVSRHGKGQQLKIVKDGTILEREPVVDPRP